MVGTDLLWEKSTAGWLVVGTDLVWEKNTAGWLADKQKKNISNLWKKKVSFPWLAVGLEPGHQAPEVMEICHLPHEGSYSILHLHLVSNLAYISHGACSLHRKATNYFLWHACLPSMMRTGGQDPYRRTNCNTTLTPELFFLWCLRRVIKDLTTKKRGHRSTSKVPKSNDLVPKLILRCMERFKDPLVPGDNTTRYQRLDITTRY